MIALLFLGCVDEGAGHLGGTTITEAWIDDFTWGSFALIAGPIGGGGRLRARAVDGDIIGQDVRWDGVAVGLGELITGGGTGRVDLTLPEVEVPGECLLGEYAGSLETFAVGAGYHELRLRNADGVEIDDGGVAIFMAVGVFYVSMELRADVHQKDAYLPRDTDGDSGGDTAPDSGQDSGDDSSGAESGGDTGGDDTSLGNSGWDSGDDE